MTLLHKSHVVMDSCMAGACMSITYLFINWVLIASQCRFFHNVLLALDTLSILMLIVATSLLEQLDTVQALLLHNARTHYQPYMWHISTSQPSTVPETIIVEAKPSLLKHASAEVYGTCGRQSLWALRLLQSRQAKLR